MINTMGLSGLILILTPGGFVPGAMMFGLTIVAVAGGVN